ncbi:MAG: LytR family transcriptional regulator [Microbacteriaceae bacterium]|nr:MAG: LytR family transcriptional regulator [Microbacteriaceae bacterium]
MTSVLRDPDRTDTAFMTKRAWWLVGLGVLVPGSAQVLAGSRRLGRFALGVTLGVWGAVVLVLLLVLVARDWLLSIATNTILLTVLVLAVVLLALLWLVLGVDTLRLARLGRVESSVRPFVAGLAVVAMVASTGGAVYAASTVSAGIGLLDAVFAERPSEDPIDGRYNILLLGGDAGPDREGLRPDSITVASVDAETGALTLIGLPRNLEDVPFSEDSPLWEKFPNGYSCGRDCQLNYLYSYGQVRHPELYPEAKDINSNPGVEAVRDAVEGALGIPMQYYVLIDMQGFADLIDALGGIDITVAERVPYGANEGENGERLPPAGYFEPGDYHFDGGWALTYARTRYGTSDYTRMERQRQVQQAIVDQMNPVNVLTKFGAVAEAGKQIVRTDIPKQMLGYFAQLGNKAQQQPITAFDIVPPQFDPENPDFAAIQAAVHELLWPTATESPTPTP